MPKMSKTDGVSGDAVSESPRHVCLTEEEIARYLFHPLSQEERFRIEKHITDCDLCYDAVAGARQFGSEKELLAHAAAIRAAVQKRYARGSEVIKGSKLMYYTAAAVVLISFSSIGYWMMSDPNGRLADEYIRPYSNTIPLTRGSQTQNLLEEGMIDYEAENYAEAVDKLQEFLKTNPDHESAHFYCGVGLLLRGQAEKSERYFQKAERSADPRISEAARWYKALAYVKMEKTEEAAALLKAIIRDGGFYASSGNSLLERLGKK